MFDSVTWIQEYKKNAMKEMWKYVEQACSNRTFEEFKWSVVGFINGLIAVWAFKAPFHEPFEKPFKFEC